MSGLSCARGAVRRALDVGSSVPVQVYRGYLVSNGVILGSSKIELPEMIFWGGLERDFRLTCAFAAHAGSGFILCESMRVPRG